MYTMWILLNTIFIFGLRISLGQDILVDQYLGCFYDNNTDWQRDTSYLNALNDNHLTLERCLQHCEEKPQMTYAKIQNGTVCQCGNKYGIQLQDSICNITCGGNPSQNCGGEFGTYIFSLPAYILFSVCPRGTYGRNCSQACHCNNQVPCERVTGRCPKGCYGNYIEETCNKLGSFFKQYIGCYRDKNDDRTMVNPTDPNSEEPLKYLYDNSLEKCSNTCSSYSYSYAGPEYGYECWCGESYGKHGNLTEKSCSSSCPGNGQQKCGGGNAISVYHSCPNGNYEKNCRKKCNCESGGCHFHNGTCQMRDCKAGWKGDACNLRDCNRGNGDCNSDEQCVMVQPVKFMELSVCQCVVGFWRNDIRGNCTDIDECSDLRDICGPFGKSCNNTEGGYICHCKNDVIVHNSSCNKPADEAGFKNNHSSTTSIAAAVVIPILAVVIVAVIVAFFYLRKSNETCSGLLNKKEDPAEKKSKTTIKKMHSRLPSDRGDINPYASSGVYDINSLEKPVNTEELPDLIRSKLSAPDLLEKEFKRVPQETKEPCNVGKDKDLKKKNRFKNIIPYDHNRVILKKRGNIALSDYINASHISSFHPSEKFIATQGPKPETVDDFWKMICEQDVGVIVMITNLMENRKVKCEKYWPDLGGTALYGEISISNRSEEHWSDYVLRRLQVTHKSRTFDVAQWHFLPWPDHGVPSDVNGFLNFRNKVRKCMTRDKATTVHCSAGVGRTGCFIAIDCLIEQGKIEGQVDIFGCLHRLRQMRCQMVQTLDQYSFVHEALLFNFTLGETTMSNGKYLRALKELRSVNHKTGLCQLDTHYQLLTETEYLVGINNSQAYARSTEKNKIPELNAAFTWGWKAKDAFITLNLPPSEARGDFYLLSTDYRCRAIIFIDTEKNLDGAIFPTNNEIKLRQHVLANESSSKEDFGVCYRISERKGRDETYANLGQFDIYSNAAGGEAEKREINVFHVTESIENDVIGFRSLISLHRNLKRLNLRKDQSSTIVIERTGFTLTGFCLAALNAFDMSAEENEVDVFQIVQEIRKSRQQFQFSLPAFKELYSVVGRFIETLGG